MGGLDLGMGAMGKLAEAGLEKMNTVGDAVRPPGSRKKKNRNIELSGLAKMEEVKDEKKLISMIDELVDCFFMYDINQVPREFRDTEKKDARTYEEMEQDIFQRECGENLMNKKNNRFLFKLLQIFGFRDESLLSFVDKDRMKKEFLDKYKKRAFTMVKGQYDFLEQFNLHYLITNLAEFREKNLLSVQAFRKIPLQTANEVKWPSYQIQKYEEACSMEK